MDMRDDPLASQTYGKLALRKMNPTDPNFRLHCAGWLGKGNECEVMRVTGAVFREVTRGPRKGELGIKVRGTERSVLVTAAEMIAFDARAKKTAKGRASLVP